MLPGRWFSESWWLDMIWSMVGLEQMICAWNLHCLKHINWNQAPKTRRKIHAVLPGLDGEEIRDLHLGNFQGPNGHIFWLVVSNMNFLGKLFPTYLAFMIFHGTTWHRTCFCTATAGSFHWRHRSRCWEWRLFREKTVWRCWHLHDVTISLLPII